jgi:pyruvate-formate lyase-activating enzyme
VNLTPDCNGRCAWCVEQRGWHPKHRASWEEIADAAVATGKQNIILLGGEPTLHPQLRQIIQRLTDAGRHVWITTNGSRLSGDWCENNLRGVRGVNISIHHWDPERNQQITGVALRLGVLQRAITALREIGATVRLNCNCIAGAIDSHCEMLNYLKLARRLGAGKVRFSELKFDDLRFVDLAEVLPKRYGLNSDPFRQGCSTDTIIDGMPVNFRQMCGFQTTRRPRPDTPVFPPPNHVLYFDGRLYDGWQQKSTEGAMDRESAATICEHLRATAESLRQTSETVAKAVEQLAREPKGTAPEPASGGWCKY